MDTATTTTDPATTVLQAFAEHDFARLADALDAEATMDALLPSGFRQWAGGAAIGAAFERWFGDTAAYEVADSSLGRIGELVALRWRLRLRAERFGDRAMVVEQHAFASVGPSGRIAHMSMLCSGFWQQQCDDGSDA